MTIDRRALLGGMTGAALLAPFLALERAMAQHAGHAPAAGSPSLEEQQAMAALQDRSAELARIKDENDPDAQAERDERDILGRLNEGASGQGDDVEIPDEIERQRAREILEAIREKLGENSSPEIERRYLERLLDIQ